jgi:multidrug efflux system membrane fusion protein
MEASGQQRPDRRGFLISGAIIGLAVLAVATVALFSRPTTDDATIDADIVHVAPAVGGRIIALAVQENALVHKGDLLFQIDPVPHRRALEQAVANLDVARATLETQRRFVATQLSNAQIAGEQTGRAWTNYDLATRTAGRLRPLTDKGYVPQQQFDQAEVAAHDAATSLRQAREQANAATRAIDTVAATEASVRAATAALALAQRALDDTTVRAPHDGRIVGLTISTGEMVIPSQALFTLVNTEEWFASANFRETDLGDMAVGDCATVFSMIDRSRPIKGVVDGIGTGVLTADRVNLPRSVPYVEPQLNWVRVTHRFPVRVKLERPPDVLVRLGASAIVEVRHGAACH